MMKKLTAIILTFTLILGFSVTANAATKKVTKKYYALHTDSMLSAFDYYGRDTIQLKYNTSKKTISSCKVSQSTKNPWGAALVKKGGVKVKKLSSKKWQYTTTWYLNFKILPSGFQQVAKKITPYLAAISDLGKFVKVTCVYQVNGNGTVKRSSFKYKFMVPSNLLGAAKQLLDCF